MVFKLVEEILVLVIVCVDGFVFMHVFELIELFEQELVDIYLLLY